MKNLADFLTIFGAQRKENEPQTPEVVVCTDCGAELSNTENYETFRVCGACRAHFTLSARERIALLADEGSFKEVNSRLVSVDPLSFTDKVPYRTRLAEAQKKTGLNDAVVTGTCKIGGRPVVLSVLDFRFLGGSMGSVVGEKITLAFELAVKRKLPVITVATSGGARMQEGMLSLVQMAKTAAAAKRLRNANLLYISVLANPTTGGIFASFANLGDIIIAEPRALIGFAGPRVVEQTVGQKVGERSHSSEFLLAHGLIDMIVERPKLRSTLSPILDLLDSEVKIAFDKLTQLAEEEADENSAWETVGLARHEHRPTSMDYITRIMSTFVELKGDRLFGDDPAVVAGLADLAGQSVMVIGQERGHGEEASSRNKGRAHPEGYRKAQRMMRMAAKFKLPVITFIDTPGADPGTESEERGLAAALAESLATMSDLPTPVISVVIGEGGSGGALALAVADRVLMLEHAIYSVISPEGAAAILYRDAARAKDVAPALKVTAHDLKTLGIIDEVVPEPEEGAHADPERAARLVETWVLRELSLIQATPLKKLLAERYQKYRRIGEYNSHFKEAVSREVEQLQGYFHRSFGQLREHLPRKGTKQAAAKPRAALPPGGE